MEYFITRAAGARSFPHLSPSIRNPDDISLPFPSPSSRFETKLGERRSPDFSFLFFFFLFIIFPAFNRDTSFPRDSNIALPG